MKTFGAFSQSELVHMVGAVRAEQPTAESACEIFARAAWSGIVEPGDRVAGMMWSALGHHQSLECFISDETPQRVAALVAERLGSDFGEGDQARAVSVLKVDLDAVMVNLSIFTLNDERYTIKTSALGKPIDRAGISALARLIEDEAEVEDDA